MTGYERGWRSALEEINMIEVVRLVRLPRVRVALGYYRDDEAMRRDLRPRLLVQFGRRRPGWHRPLWPERLTRRR